jgi:phenylpyruvate tautomerase PptA (4-oxalocrotonate tautomerase family)
MPLLSITGSVDADAAGKADLFETTGDAFVDVMDSRRSFLSVTYDHLPRDSIWLGRADPEADVVLLEADVREGRPAEQRREFAMAFMDAVHEQWGVPRPNLKVVFTEHEGPHLMGYDRVGGEWEPDGAKS